MSQKIDPGSFRDPAGYVFSQDGAVYRAVTEAGRAEYEAFAASKLRASLVRKQRITDFQERPDPVPLAGAGVAQVLQPEYIPFISYPYEWCFSQLREAALLTLEIQQEALAAGFTLKDASAYNISFVKGKPVHFDTLSFAPYVEGQPWVAYRQFCSHFLAPLLLMVYRDQRLRLMLRDHIDGIPLDLAATLLPLRARARFSVMTHIVLHALSIRNLAGKPGEATGKALSVSKNSLLGLLDNLRRTVSSLKMATVNSQWSGYEQSGHYTAAARELKAQLVGKWAREMGGSGLAMDLGCNTGEFTQELLAAGHEVIACDGDHQVAEILHERMRGKLTALVMDLGNVSGGIGWAAEERSPLAGRAEVQMLCALGLVHHLAISGGVPFARVAEYFARLGRHLIIEYIGPTDEKAAFLLRSSSLPAERFSREAFESAFSGFYDLRQRVELPGMDRTMYLFAAKS